MRHARSKVQGQLARALPLALALVLAGFGADASAAGGDLRDRGRVTDIADGDTISVELRGREESIRLIGIDTPEVYFGEECGGAAASRSINRMLEPGDRVTLIRDPSQDNRDSYNRLLRYVVHGGRDVGRVQIRRGWAAVFVFEERFDRVGSYRRAQRKARHADRGVWRRCDGDFHDPL